MDIVYSNMSGSYKTISVLKHLLLPTCSQQLVLGRELGGQTMHTTPPESVERFQHNKQRYVSTENIKADMSL